jgi:methionyl-tRNA synthetase
MNTILYVLVNVIHQLAILTQPLMPDASGKILDQLAIEPKARTFAYLKTLLIPGTSLPLPVGVFPRFQEGDKVHASG